MTTVKMKRLGNQILATCLASILVVSAASIAMLTLTPVPAFAPNENDNNNNNNNNNNGDNNNNNNNNGDDLQLLIDLVECFNGNDLEQCLNDAIDDYFNNNGGN